MTTLHKTYHALIGITIGLLGLWFFAGCLIPEAYGQKYSGLVEVAILDAKGTVDNGVTFTIICKLKDGVNPADYGSYTPEQACGDVQYTTVGAPTIHRQEYEKANLTAKGTPLTTFLADTRGTCSHVVWTEIGWVVDVNDHNNNGLYKDSIWNTEYFPRYGNPDFDYATLQSFENGYTKRWTDWYNRDNYRPNEIEYYVADTSLVPRLSLGVNRITVPVCQDVEVRKTFMLKTIYPPGNEESVSGTGTIKLSKAAKAARRRARRNGNYPNPFNPTTTITYEMPTSGDVRISVYDMMGRELDVLVNGHKEAGDHSVMFSLGDLPSGMYIYRIQTEAKSLIRTMTAIK